MLSELTHHQWLFALLAAASIGLGKGGLSGLGNLSIWLMAEAFGPRASVGIALPVLICADIVAVLVYRRHADWAHLWRLLPILLFGIVIGYFLFDAIPADRFGLVMGILLLGLTAVHLLRKFVSTQQPAGPELAAGVAEGSAATAAQSADGKVVVPAASTNGKMLARSAGTEGSVATLSVSAENKTLAQGAGAQSKAASQNVFTARWVLWLTGILGGIATMLANAAGPIISFYLLAAKMPKYAFIGTGAWLYLIINIAKTPFQAALDNMDFKTLQISLTLGGVAAVFTLIAPLIVRHIPQKLFEALIWTAVVFASLRLIF